MSEMRHAVEVSRLSACRRRCNTRHTRHIPLLRQLLSQCSNRIGILLDRALLRLDHRPQFYVIFCNIQTIFLLESYLIFISVLGSLVVGWCLRCPPERRRNLTLQLFDQGAAQKRLEVGLLGEADVQDELAEVGVVLNGAVFAK